jgi:hypothetical protein
MLDRRVTKQDVVEVLDALEQEEVLVWLDGGWASKRCREGETVARGSRSRLRSRAARGRAVGA